MLDNVSKLLKHLHLTRLSTEVAANGPLSDSQYNIRQGSGKTQVIEEVLSMADAAASGPS